ncbi:MAG: hypothetical protein ACYCPV_04680 [Thermoplasmata archaeon]|jgi:hypothetical protein
MDLSGLIQAILFGLFALLTAALAAIIGPTYDHLFVPEMQPGALFPQFLGSVPSPNFLSRAAGFSSFLLANVVDPAIALVAVGLGIAYLSRSVLSRYGASIDTLLIRMIVAVIAANFVLPIADGILAVAGGMYPLVAQWDGGAWESWVNLGGYGMFSYSWGNGALTFVLAFVLFSSVFLLTLAIAVRDALLAVLLVVLPLFTLLWPFRPLSPLARRAWFLFGEMAFLPCILVIPLELAVGSPNVVLLTAFLSVALASPFLLSLAGTPLTSLGFPAVGPMLSSATQRGLALVSSAGASYFGPAAAAAGGSAASGGGLGAGAFRAAQSAGAPATAPLALGEAIGHGAVQLIRHIPPRTPAAFRFPPSPPASEEP